MYCPFVKKHEKNHKQKHKKNSCILLKLLFWLLVFSASKVFSLKMEHNMDHKRKHKKKTTKKNTTWTTKKTQNGAQNNHFLLKQKSFFLWSMLLALTFLFLKTKCGVTAHCLWFGNMIKHASYNCKHSEFGIRIPCTGSKTEKADLWNWRTGCTVRWNDHIIPSGKCQNVLRMHSSLKRSHHTIWKNVKMSWECCCILASSQSCSHLVQKTWKQVGWQEKAYIPHESKGHSL